MVDWARDDPMELFSEWFADARATELSEPDAMALATTDGSGQPSIRMVLLKAVDDVGFVFYTNLASRKATELDHNPRAALCFHWMPLRRQVRVRGRAGLVSDAEADGYFATRPRKSRIGAWASKQSQVMESDLELHKRVARFATRFAVGDIPRPPFWSGYRLVPDEIEFWADRDFRLHERLLYVRCADGWERQRLYP